MIGELVGARYKVTNVLASGGFGHTYIAEDIQRPGNPRCVLKHLTFHSQNPDVLQQVRRLFQAEAETLEHLGKHDQIPRLLAYFEENQQFYLVQELVDGDPLSKELIKGVRLLEAEVIPILEDVLTVLEFVHAQGVIHRDIKPANLIRRRQDSRLVLIDFGAVKLIGHTVAEATGETALSMPVYTSGYAACEQCIGRPRFSSDLYSLGMVGIQALTGLHPAQLPHDARSEILWRDQASVSDALAEVISTMTRYNFNDRYQSASEALQALRRVIATAPTLLTNPTTISSTHSSITHLNSTTTHSPHNPTQLNTYLRSPAGKTTTRIGLAIAGTIAIAILVRSFTDAGFQAPVSLPSVSDPETILKEDNRISAGEKSLMPWQTQPQKQEGIDYIAAGAYGNAVTALEAVRQKQLDDPELLIYLNNARINQDKSYTIAVVAPISSDVLSSALELLRGVAQAQDEVNRNGGINGVPLRVLIVDDSNQPDIAEQVAKRLADQPLVLGVVGHGSSDTSSVAGKIYQDRGLTLISPVSSAVELSNIGNQIFRTMPSDKQTANALKDHLLHRLKRRRVAVFYNSNSQYSRSLKEEFGRALIYSGVAGAQVVKEIDLARPGFDPEDALKQAIASRAQALMLAPNGEVMDKAVRLVEVTDRKLPILAGDSMFTSNLLRFGKAAATGIVLAVPVDLTRSPFQQTATVLWGNPELVSWRTALAYDATKAFVAALEENPSRSGIRRSLVEPTFSAQGATGVINFQPEGSRYQSPAFVTVAPTGKGANRRYTFIPLPQPKWAK